MKPPIRVDVLGVPVDCVDMEGALAVVDDTIAGNRQRVILAVNPEKVMVARKDGAVLASLKQAGLLIPDGIGVVLAVRLLTKEKIERVPGAELLPAICGRAVEKNYKIFLYGAKPEVKEGAVQALRDGYPSEQAGQHFLASTLRRHPCGAIEPPGAQLGSSVNGGGCEVKLPSGGVNR